MHTDFKNLEGTLLVRLPGGDIARNNLGGLACRGLCIVFGRIFVQS